MSADALLPASITGGLETAFIGQEVIYHPRLPSTMDAARQAARRGAAAGTVIIAGEQTGGRGRRIRSWLSPPGNIALSVILYPEVSYLPYLVMLASLAVVYAIEAVADLKPQIKWPNDVLVDGRKVCGILVESEVARIRVNYAVVGIGINVALKASEFPEISAVATSLNDASGRSISCVELVRCLLVELERLYRALSDAESIYEAWRDRLITLGKRVYVESGGDVIEGIAEAVDGSGAMRLRRADGSSIRIVAGDVTLRDK